MKIATWNVNSITIRLPHILNFLHIASPDIVLLQELKCTEDKFPWQAIEDKNYHIVVSDQKSWNGVAILSKHPITDVQKALPGDAEDLQARYIEATIQDLRIACVYLPNGNPVESEKYPYKLKWCQRLFLHLSDLLKKYPNLVIAGDYNIIPTDEDCHDSLLWQNDALFKLESRKAWRRLLNIGFTDAFRALHPNQQAYTFWDYQGGAWEKNHGIRIDHILLSPFVADRLQGCEILHEMRSLDRASDHVPMIVNLSEVTQ